MSFRKVGLSFIINDILHYFQAAAFSLIRYAQRPFLICFSTTSNLTYISTISGTTIKALDHTPVLTPLWGGGMGYKGIIRDRY